MYIETRIHVYTTYIETWLIVNQDMTQVYRNMTLACTRRTRCCTHTERWPMYITLHFSIHVVCSQSWYTCACFFERKRAVESVHASVNTDTCVSLHLQRDLQTRGFWDSKSYVSMDIQEFEQSHVSLRIKAQNGALLRRYGALFHLIKFSDQTLFWNKGRHVLIHQTCTHTCRHVITPPQGAYWGPFAEMWVSFADIRVYADMSVHWTCTNRFAHTQYTGIMSSKQHGIDIPHIYIYAYVNIYLWMRRFQNECTRCPM